MNLKKNNKGAVSNKALTGIVIALAAVIVVLIIIIVVGINRTKKDSVNATTEGTEAATEATKSDADNATTEKSQEGDFKQADCYVKVTNDNSWESGDKYCGGLSISIVNDSANELGDWRIDLDIPDGFSLDGSWNGNFNTEKNVLSITSVDYNETIPANGEIKDIGCNVTVSSKEELDALCLAASLYIGGELYSSAMESGSSTSEKTTEKSDEETTETKTLEKPKTESGTPLENHGKLSVNGTDIVDKNGDRYQLKGLSTHGLAWFPEYVNKDAFQSFRDDWNANLIRLAMYTDEYGGYCNGGDKENLKQLIDTGVQSATELGMYVIIDWHILNDLTPVKYQSEAESFFAEMSAKYKDYDNVIYEICNEPNGGTSWSEIKGYAEDIIPIIRENDSDAIIIVGTPNWSQDVDVVADDPITGYDNIMYAIHFYAATHTDSIRSKVKTAHDKGLPIFVSEFSICDASGNGSIDYDQAKLWFDLIGDYNMSYVAWNISNKDETSSVIKSSCTKTSGWSDDDLSDTGIWIKNQMSQ